MDQREYQIPTMADVIFSSSLPVNIAIYEGLRRLAMEVPVPEEMKHRLIERFSPESLFIHDQSAAHRGHAGAASGGHYEVVMTSTVFSGKSRLERHRLVFDVLGDLIGNGIHALSLKLRAPGEGG